MKKLIIFGAGYPIIIQHILDINDAGEKMEILGFVVDTEENWGKDFYGYPILGKLEDIEIKDDYYIINNIGSTPKARKMIDERIYALKNYIPSLIHPTVERRFSSIGEGCIISKDTYIGAGSSIGDSVCLRNQVFIAHDVIIGDYTFMSDQTVVLGYVKIGNSCYIGANATVLPRLSVGDNSVIGAGAVVTKNIPDREIWVGNPSKFLKKNNNQF